VGDGGCDDCRFTGGHDPLVGGGAGRLFARTVGDGEAEVTSGAERLRSASSRRAGVPCRARLLCGHALPTVTCAMRLSRVRDVDLAAYLAVPIGTLRRILSEAPCARVGEEVSWYRWKDLKKVLASDALRKARLAAKGKISESSSRYWVDGYPDLVAQWHSRNRLLPYQVSHGSEKKVWWKCPADPDHEWRTQVNGRTRGAGCPFCTTRFVSVTNSLVTCRPDIAAQWHPVRNGKLTPDGVLRGSHRRVWWKCPEGIDHEWATEVHQRTFPASRGCPFCAGQRVTLTNSLASRAPEIAREWAVELNGDLTPADVTAGTRTAVWWRCSAVSAHVWKATINNRVVNQSRCPFCSKRRVLRGESLAGVSPRAAKLWHPTKNGNRRKPEDTSAATWR
jgi:hypothetical protein